MMLLDDRLVTQDVVDQVAKFCIGVVQETFDVKEFKLVIHRTDKLEANMKWKDGAVHIDINAPGSKVWVWYLVNFAHVLTHELTEWTLGVESLSGGTLYRYDQANRPIGDGIAEYVSSQAIVRARAAGYPLLDRPILDRVHPHVVLLERSMEDGIKTVRLTGWAILTDTDHEQESKERSLRYASAEYLISEWVTAAKQNGVDRPLLEFWKWLQAHPGPSYHELTDWMENISGLDVRKLADAVPLDRVLAYYKRLYGKRLCTTPLQGARG